MKLSSARDTHQDDGARRRDDAGAASGGAAPIAETSLAGLYEQHARRLRAMLVRLGVPSNETEDALHEVFVVACRRLHTLRDPNAIVGWLNGIAVAVAASLRRRARFRRFIGLEHAPDPTRATDPAFHLERRQAKETVYAALEGMKDKKRTVFILFELEGLSGEEIATAVGCPLKTVWTRLFHARREFLARLAAIEAAGQGGAR